MASGKRGRPRTERPFFADQESERLRVDQCIKEGRDPYPPCKHEPCAAELELRKGVMPGVPFDLVLTLNDSDCEGLPLFNPKAEAKWDEAQAKRKQDARSGGEMKPKANLAASVIADHAHFIQTKKAEGARKSDVINWINTFRLKASLEIVGRSEMYRQLTASGLWD
jgi:hypothetical protein